MTKPSTQERSFLKYNIFRRIMLIFPKYAQDINCMEWNIIAKIADILGIISFLISILSLGIIKKLYSKTIIQKESYNQEHQELLCYLSAIRQNIWDDGLITPKLQDVLQSKINEYQIKYFFISSPRCLYHAFRCTYLLKKGINNTNTNKIRQDINYLIARLSKKE